MLKQVARNMPSWDCTRHVLPMHSVTIPANATVTDSGAVHAIVTAGSRDLREALTLMEVARKIGAPVPENVDMREQRYAATWWMQPRNRD